GPCSHPGRIIQEPVPQQDQNRTGRSGDARNGRSRRLRHMGDPDAHPIPSARGQSAAGTTEAAAVSSSTTASPFAMVHLPAALTSFGLGTSITGQHPMIRESRTEPPRETSWEQRLLGNANRKGGLKPEYQELKFILHRKLLDRINLDALASIDDDRIRSEVRQAVLTIADGEPTLLTAAEKLQIGEEVLHEV